jgi:hypothetical protein
MHGRTTIKIVYTHILINAKLPIGNRDQKTELIGRSALWGRGPALDCSAIEEEYDVVCD